MGREYHGVIDESMELTSAERLHPNDLASKTNGHAATSTDDNGFNPYAHCTVRLSSRDKDGLEKWLNFIKQCINKSNTNG